MIYASNWYHKNSDPKSHIPPGFNPPTLKNCLELRELVLVSYFPKSGDFSLITTIASTNIRKITFREWTPRPRFVAILDTALSDLVDRLCASGYEHTLQLEIQPPKYPEADFDPNLGRLFPRFIAKGQVAVVGARSGKLLYCSGG